MIDVVADDLKALQDVHLVIDVVADDLKALQDVHLVIEAAAGALSAPAASRPSPYL